MIYVFAGDDREKRQKASDSLLKSLPGFEVLRFDDVGFDESSLDSLSKGDDLFARDYAVVLDRVLESANSPSILSRIESLRDSKNKFIFIENSLDKVWLETFKEVAEKIETFDLPKGKNERFNIFAITDAFASKDKKKTWVLAQKALREDIAPEEILNVLIWQTKNLLSVKGENDMKKTGLSPFVFDKARRYSEKWNPEELKNASRKLTTLFHESHLGLDLGANLELFILKSL